MNELGKLVHFGLAGGAAGGSGSWANRSASSATSALALVIGYLEKELRSPSAETLKRLAMAFDRDLWSIIAEAEEKASGSGEES